MNYNYLKVLPLALITGLLLFSCHSNTETTTESTTTVDSTAKTAATPPADSITMPKKDTMSAEKTKQDTAVAPVNAGPKPLTVIINNLASDTAPVEISIYSKNNKFPSPKDQLKVFRFSPKGNVLTAQLPGITFGEYAIAAYQDLDGDGKIGKNMIGIPTDPYGFSNNYKPTIKAPAFKDCRFEYNDNMNTVSIKMIR